MGCQTAIQPDRNSSEEAIFPEYFNDTTIFNAYYSSILRMVFYE